MTASTKSIADVLSDAGATFVLQRYGDHGFFDADTFATKEAALTGLKRAKWNEESRIRGNGGTSYTMERPQRMRVIEVIA